MAVGLGVDPLRVSLRHVAQDLDLRFDHAERLRVSTAYSSPTTLDHRRFADLLFPEVDDLFHEPIKIRIDRLDLRLIADEIRWHLFSAPSVRSSLFPRDFGSISAPTART